MAAIADAIPGFAGYRLHADGSVKVMMVPGTKRTAAQSQSLRTFFGKRIVQQDARYDFRALHDWKKKIEGLFGDQRGLLQMVDIDEEANRIVVGVDTRGRAERLARAKAMVRSLKIPAAALRFEDHPPATSLLNNAQAQRPASGGVLLGFNINGDIERCTLGVSVIRSGVAGFVTASHCKGTLNPANGSPAYQPYPTRIGAIAAIGPTVSTGCDSGVTCVNADALFVRVDTASSVRPGWINYTAGYEQYDILGQYKISAVDSFPDKGQKMMYTGATTGTATNGAITRTCVTAFLGNVSVFCTNYFSISGQRPRGGDSGSPVYYKNADGTVNLSGILAAVGQTEAIYGPWSQVQKQLGTLSLF